MMCWIHSNRLSIIFTILFVLFADRRYSPSWLIDERLELLFVVLIACNTCIPDDLPVVISSSYLRSKGLRARVIAVSIQTNGIVWKVYSFASTCLWKNGGMISDAISICWECWTCWSAQCAVISSPLLLRNSLTLTRHSASSADHLSQDPIRIDVGMTMKLEYEGLLWHRSCNLWWWYAIR